MSDSTPPDDSADDFEGRAVFVAPPLPLTVQVERPGDWGTPGDWKLTASGKVLSEPIVAEARQEGYWTEALHQVSYDLTVQVLAALCKDWEPPETDRMYSGEFYVSWEHGIQQPPSPPLPSAEMLSDLKAAVEASYQRELESFRAQPTRPWRGIQQRLHHNFIIHYQRYHFWTGPGRDLGEQMAYGLLRMAGWINTPLQRTLADDLEVLAADGEVFKNLWGPAF